MVSEERRREAAVGQGREDLVSLLRRRLEVDRRHQGSFLQVHQGKGRLEPGVPQFLEQVPLERREGDRVGSRVDAGGEEAYRGQFVATAERGDPGGGGRRGPAEREWRRVSCPPRDSNAGDNSNASGERHRVPEEWPDQLGGAGSCSSCSHRYSALDRNSPWAVSAATKKTFAGKVTPAFLSPRPAADGIDVDILIIAFPPL